MNLNTIKNRALLVLAPLLLKPKSISEQYLKRLPLINCSQHEIKFIISSTFNVAYLENNNIKGYFRECRVHSSESTFLNEVIKDYFDYICNRSDKIVLKEEIYKYLNNKKNKKKFMNMGILNDKESTVYLFFKNTANTEIIGIPKVHSKELDEILPEFIQYIWGEIYAYKLNKGLKIGEFQTFNSSRQIATKVLADKLDMGELIPDTQYVKLKINGGKERLGTLMSIAKGISPEELDDKTRKRISPQFQREMSNLNMLDVICRQKDHRPGHDSNYNVEVNSEGFIISVSAFDNDSPTSFFPSKKIGFMTSAKTTSLINKKGVFDRLYIDQNISKKIEETPFSEINILLKDILTPIQLKYLEKRYNALCVAIKNSRESKTSIFLDLDEWNQKTIDNEINDCIVQENRISYMYAFYQMLY